MENLSAKDKAQLAGNGRNAVFRTQIYSQNREAKSVHPAGNGVRY